MKITINTKIMTKPYYKVWIHIEKIDEDNDEYEDADEPIALDEHFETLEQASAARDILFQIYPNGDTY